MKIINPFDFELSQEQIHIVETCVKDENKIVAIEACAGSSKTTSLVAVASNLKKKSMFLTFSKALADEAKGEFPSYVDCRTIHSLAYKFVGKDYVHKLKRPTGGYKNVCGTGKEISKYFKIEPIQVSEDQWVSSVNIGHIVKETLSRYENSWDDKITNDHVPYSEIKKLEDKFKKLWSNAYTKKLKGVVTRTARKLWKLRIDIDSDVLCTHDTYQKLYALSNPKIDTEVLYLDEVQDATMVFVGVVLDQIKKGHCKVVCVGDRDQSIYGWRGSCMLNDFIEKDFITCNLTHSFRYGQKVADIAMKILDNGKVVKGFDKVNTKVTEVFDTDDYDKVTYLFRTNANLVDAALDLIEAGETVNIEIDLNDYLVLLDSVNALKEGNLKYIKHSEVLAYESWEEFEEDVENNATVKRVYDVVRRGDYWHVKSLLKNHSNHPSNKFTMSTSHKSKGRTYDNVLLAEDFPSNYSKEGKWVGIKDEEKRLLYVACTRAKNTLGYNTTIKEILEYVPEEVEDVFKTLVKREADDLEKLVPNLK